jgi:hypothetical protein
MSGSSECLGDGAGTDAASADLDGTNGPLVECLDLLQVGVPDFTGFVMGMADVIAGRRFFSANFTNSGHIETSWMFRTRILITPYRYLQLFFTQFLLNIEPRQSQGSAVSFVFAVAGG